MLGRSLASIQKDNEFAARKDKVESYLKGRIRAEYDKFINSDKEIKRKMLMLVMREE